MYTVRTVLVIDDSLRLTDEETKAKFPKGWKAPRPYLPLTPRPNK
ncbi:MAG: hypothetical protein ACREKG_06305 [Candidatus Rokuibacteriota bacterium]